MGRYGDTRVPTRLLFDAHDPACTGPPADAIDIQFRAPLTTVEVVPGLVELEVAVPHLKPAVR